MKKQDWWIAAIIAVLILSCIGSMAQKKPVTDTLYVHTVKPVAGNQSDTLQIVQIVVGGITAMFAGWLIFKTNSLNSKANAIHKDFNSKMDAAIIASKALGDSEGYQRGRSDERKYNDDQKTK